MRHRSRGGRPGVAKAARAPADTPRMTSIDDLHGLVDPDPSRPERVRVSASWVGRTRPALPAPVRRLREVGAARGTARARRARPHVDPIGVAGRWLVCGARRAAILHAEPGFVIGSGPEEDLWLAIAGAARRPRPHDPLPPGAPPARVEPNGLVRVLDRRTSLEEVLELARALGAPVRRAPPPGRRIPPGRYAGIEIGDDGPDYRIVGGRLGERALESIRAEPLGAGAYRVRRAHEGRLRRLVVARTLPLGHRMLLGATLKGRVGGRAVHRLAVEPRVARTLARAA